MTHQAPLPYMHAAPPPPAHPWETDLAHLRTLAICHYVVGGLTIAFASVFIIHIVMGIVLLRNPAMMAPPPGSGAAPPPAFLSWLFIGMGATLVTLGWTTGTLTILAGRGLARQRWRALSLVMAGVNCLWVPIGTILGVFTFVVLLRPSVEALYRQRAADEAALAAGGSSAAAAAAG